MKDTNKSKFWTQHIQVQLSSGHTQKEYCNDHGLNIHTSISGRRSYPS